MSELHVQNMTCGHCVSAVTSVIKSIDPRAEVQVDLRSGRVRVEGTSPLPDLVKALDEAGYPAAQAESQATTKKSGCCCSADKRAA
jgi:copper chaperone